MAGRMPIPARMITTRLCASLSTSRPACRDVDKLRPIRPEFFTRVFRLMSSQCETACQP